MNNYSLEKLTATEPSYDFAFMFIQGMDHPMLVSGRNKMGPKARWIRDEEVVIITIPDSINPMEPGREATMTPNGPIEAREPGMAALETHVHIDQINAINFYTAKERPAVATPKSNPSKILTAQGENLATAREREELESKKSPIKGVENSVEEKEKPKGGKKSKDNDLKKV